MASSANQSCTWSALAAAVALTTSCGPKRPENAIIVDFGCFELQHVGGWHSSGIANFGEVIVRSEDDTTCPTLAELGFTLFADTNVNGVADESEVLLATTEEYGAFTTNARIYPTENQVARGDGPLWYRIVLVDSQGEEYVSAGACPE